MYNYYSTTEFNHLQTFDLYLARVNSGKKIEFCVFHKQGENPYQLAEEARVTINANPTMYNTYFIIDRNKRVYWNL